VNAGDRSPSNPVRPTPDAFPRKGTERVPRPTPQVGISTAIALLSLLKGGTPLLDLREESMGEGGKSLDPQKPVVTDHDPFDETA